MHKPTVEQLNAIQAEWMAMPYDAPREAVIAIAKKMELAPRDYLVLDKNKKPYPMWAVISHGSPLTSLITYEEAVEIANNYKIQTDLVWTTDGYWIANTRKEINND